MKLLYLTDLRCKNNISQNIVHHVSQQACQKHVSSTCDLQNLFHSYNSSGKLEHSVCTVLDTSVSFSW